jgi:hypothetical protein
VDRDGVTYRMIGKMVIEQIGADGGVTRSYLHADHSDSVRMITNDGGQVVSSLGYEGDWGLTSISGQANAASYSDMASFYRFQGQEQEIFPLANLKIEDESLAAWLDGIQLYHYPLRDYAAGLSVFLETDPFPTEDSLYAAFGANPANYTDPSGGMIQLDDAEILIAHPQDPNAAARPRRGPIACRAARRRALDTSGCATTQRRGEGDAAYPGASVHAAPSADT